jgi:hypothetical protein
MNAEELIAILRQGEGTRVEFKSDFPVQSHAIGKEMAALANSGGGVLLMGVTDDGAPKGIEDADRVVERLAGIARSCGLSISPEIDKFQVSKNVFIVYAKIRSCPPCFYEGKIYHRVGSTSVECSSGDQLRNILASGSVNQFLPHHSQFGKSSVTATPFRGTARPRHWSGYWFVNVGEGAHRNWDDSRRYGFISAGQGVRYSSALRILPVGAKIFAYVSRWGYVGYGEVTYEAMPIKDFVIETERKRLLDLPLLEERIAENSDNLELSEWVVAVRWLRTFPRNNARTLKGVPSYRNIVCKLTHPTTIKFLESEFGVTERTATPSTEQQAAKVLDKKLAGPTKRRKDEVSFFETLERKSSAEEVGVARRILVWSKEKFSDINWGTASFSPVLHYGHAHTHNPITVYTSGKAGLNAKVGLKFKRMMKRNPPFNSVENRLELLRRLNEIPGIDLHVDSIGKFPTIPLAPLADDQAFLQFQQAIEWTIEEVKAAKSNVKN